MTLYTRNPIQRTLLWLLALICLVTLLPFLGDTLFNTRGEPREAIVAQSMLAHGNWILPVNNGVDIAYKPPLFHWFVALCSLPFGAVSEYTSRLPSALALTVMTLGVYSFYSHRRGSGFAFMSSLVMLSSFEVHRAGIACRVDMVLTCMMVMALFQLYEWVEKDMRRVPWWGIVFLSGAFLSKGPVGLALPCLVPAVFAWIRGKGFGRIFLSFLGVGLAACVLPALWYMSAWEQGGDRFLALVYEENILRLLGKMTYESHINPWPYNVLTLVAGFVPYTLLVVLSLFCLKYRKPRLKVSQWWGHFTRYIREMDDARLFTLLSFAIIFVFYCIPKSKRSVYLLPVYPFVAYYLTEYMLWLRRCHRGVVILFVRILAVLAILLPLAFVCVRFGCVPAGLVDSGDAAVPHNLLASLQGAPIGFMGWVAPVLPILLGGMCLCSVSSRKTPLAIGDVVGGGKRYIDPLKGSIALVICLLWSLDGLYLPIVLNGKSDKPVAEYIETLAPQGHVYSFRKDVVPGNPMHPFTINFYLGDRVVPFEAFRPKEGLLIVGDDAIEAFAERHPDYRTDLVRDFGHRSCDDHKYLKLYRFAQVPRP